MTIAQFKARLRQQGKTVRQWADENGFPPSAVYRVIGGIDKANFGRAHDIAVAISTPQSQQQGTAFDLAARLTPENIAVMRSAADQASGNDAERLVVLLACAEELIASDLSADDLHFISCYIHMCRCQRPSQIYGVLSAARLRVNPEAPTA